MKFFLISLVFITCVFTCNATSHNVETPQLVYELISAIEKLSKCDPNQDDIAYQLKDRIRFCFEDNIRCENNNEFNILGIKCEPFINNYCNTLYAQLWESRTLKEEHKILYTIELDAPNHTGGRDTEFYETRIQKTCTYNNNRVDMWQVIEIPYSGERKIVSFDVQSVQPDWIPGNNNGKRNRNNESIKSNGNNNSSSGNTIQSNYKQLRPMSEKEYLHQAARFYTDKDYDKAINTYIQLTEDYPQCGEGWYRLASIVRYKTKWSKKYYKDPKKEAINFMQKAEECGSGNIKSKAYEAWIKWEYPLSF